MQSKQPAIFCEMSLDMFGQKYNWRAKTIVFVTPEWDKCSSSMIFLRAGAGTTCGHQVQQDRCLLVDRAKLDEKGKGRQDKAPLLWRQLRPKLRMTSPQPLSTCPSVDHQKEH